MTETTEYDEEYDSEYDDESQSDQSVEHTESRTLNTESKHVSSHSSLVVGKLHTFDAQNDQGEALEFNGEELPDEFILAKLAFNDDHEQYWRDH